MALLKHPVLDMRRAFLVLALMLLISPAAIAQDSREELLRYGEQLAQECVTCHRRDGKDEGIPGIIFMSEADIIAALTLYKTGRRDNKVMVSVAASLDERQMQALAAYLSSLGQAAPPPTPPKPRLAR